MDKILILDFGSQFTQLIARKIREAKVYCEIYHFDISLATIKKFNPKGIILSGSPNSVYDEIKYDANKEIFNLNIPILGICYGMQWMVNVLGGKIKSASNREFGYAKVYYQKESKLTSGIYDNLDPTYIDVWMSHADHVSEIPLGFKQIGFSKNCKYALIANEDKNFYGVQFHPEVTHTTKGKLLLEKFVHIICKAQDNWTMANYIEVAIHKINNLVQNEEVILGLSGGVDSTVAAVLIHKAIKNRLTCVFVDNGLLRLNEKDNVYKMFSKNLKIKVIYVDASQQFLKKLNGIKDPEQKRKIIGNEFIQVFQEQANKLNNIKWLAQGTIYPDVIESSKMQNSSSQVIKSHHNVGGLPEQLNLKLLEPLKDLFKDEVRQLGIELGINQEIIFRHPFPGVGLAVRILGEVKLEYINLLRKADYIFIQELKNNFDEDKISWYDKVSQAFVVFLPLKSVGVMGDSRTYEHIVSLRAVVSDDFMSAKFSHLPFELLSSVSNKIVNEVKGINRVVYDISSKPPATIEWE